jgi:methionyl-tRNA formyltransferase
MRIAFITQNDPFYVREFFEEFCSRHLARKQVVAVIIAPAMGKKSLFDLARQMWGFYGPRDFAWQGMRFALYSIANLLPAAFFRQRSFSIAKVASRHGIPVKFVPDVNSAEFIQWVRDAGIDVIASVAAPQIFRDQLIRSPRLGCVNIHNSKVPMYRGMLPNFWQMYSGEKTVGITVHRINAKLDDGAILAQIEEPIRPGESLDSLIRRTKRLGAKLLSDTLLALDAGTVIERSNEASAGCYFSFPTREDVAEFRRRGYRLI